MVVWLQMRISACFTSSDSENEDEGDEEVEVEDVAMSLHHELKQVNLHLFDNNSDTPHTCYSQETDAQQAVIVAMFNAMVTFTVFAPLCPLLPLLSPCFAYTNLYANNWVEQQQEIGKSRIAREFLVQKPVKSFCTITVAFQIVVVIGISIDLQFAAGCIIFYVVFCIGAISVATLLHFKLCRGDLSEKSDYPRTKADLIVFNDLSVIEFRTRLSNSQTFMENSSS